MPDTTSAPAKRNLTVPILLLLGGGTFYGSFFSAIRVASDAGVPPMALAFWQAFFGGVGLLIFSAVIRQLPGTGFAHLRQYTVTAFIGFSLPLIALTVVSAKLPVGVLTLVVTLTPALTYIFAYLARLDRLNVWSVGGIVLGLAGVLLIVLPAGSLGEGFSPAWLLLGLIAPLGYAMNNIAVVFLRPAQTTSLHLSTGVLLVATVVLLPVMLVVDGAFVFSGLEAKAVWSTAWAGFTNVVIFLSLFEIIRRAGPVFFAQFNYVVVVASIVWARLIFSETFSVWVWAAIAVMAVGLVLANAGTNKSAKATAAEAAEGE
ncbi:MAG: DMT family transporter [Proteobacteria bacterium]|nr:DMT family transporter [Pseudomonadota bacterium]